MAKVFEEYARFYDDFYKEKDYAKEVDYVVSLAGKVAKTIPTSVLDMGCGTGKHIVPFVRKGLKAAGFDFSATMVGYAQKNLEREGIRASINQGDARTYRDGKKYDLVVSMFAVLGYLTTNEDFLKGLETARAHMHSDSTFIFDVWFGPAVLRQLPETRVQEFKTEGLKTIRIAKPLIDVVRQSVTVEYHIMKLDGTAIVQEAIESHTMRYFIAQELSLFLGNAGLILDRIHPFMDADKSPTIDDWNITVVAKPV